MIASLPREQACKMFSCAPSQRGSAIFRHRYIASGYAPREDLERVTRLELATSPWQGGALPLSYTRSFEGETNNVQPFAARNLLIVARGLEIVESKQGAKRILRSNHPL